MNIRRRILIPMITLTIVSCIAVLISSILLYSRELNMTMHSKIDVAQNVLVEEIGEYIKNAHLTSAAMRVHQNLSDALIHNDRERVATIANSLRNMAQLDFCTIVNKDGIVITRTHDPTNYGDDITDQSHIKSALLMK